MLLNERAQPKTTNESHSHILFLLNPEETCLTGIHINQSNGDFLETLNFSLVITKYAPPLAYTSSGFQAPVSPLEAQEV